MPDQTAAAPPPPPSRFPIIIPGVVATAFLMEQLDATIITTAIPDMARSLSVTPVQMSLAVAAYVLSVAIFIPVSGWFADRFGSRRVFVAALAIFTLGSILCGLAQNFPMLIAMRVLQGLGGAMMTPVGRLILLQSFPRSELMRAMVYMTLPAVVGPVIGPLLGGVLTTYLSWHWIFYMNVPFGLIGIALAIRYVKNVRATAVARFDILGFLMVGGGLGLLQFALENVSHPLVSPYITVASMGLSVALLTGFGVYARSTTAPAVDLSLFRYRAFSVATLAGGVCRIALGGVPYLLPLMLQVGFGLSPIVSGSITFISSIGGVLIRNYIPRAVRRFGFKSILIVSAVASSGVLAGFALMQPDTSHAVLLFWVFLFGFTRSSQFMTSNTLAYVDLPERQLSSGTSLGGALQQLSQGLGVSTAAILLALVGRDAAVMTPAIFHYAFLLTAILPLLAIPGFLTLSATDGSGMYSGGNKKEGQV